MRFDVAAQPAKSYTVIAALLIGCTRLERCD